MKKPALAILLGTGVVLLGIYIGFGVYYNNHFFPKTTIDGISCGNKTSAYLESKNIADADNYTLTIKDRKENSFTISGSDISYRYEAKGEEKKLLKKQNGFAWPAALFQTHSGQLNSSFLYDEKALLSHIESLKLFDKDYITRPKSAYLNITDDDYQVVDEIPGNQPVKEEVISEIAKAVDTHQTSVTLSDDCYKNPKVLASDGIIADTVSKIDDYTSATVSYQIDGVDEKVDKGRILSFLKIKKNGAVSLDEDKVTSYVQHLASTYNTYGDVRTFHTSNDDDVKIGGGDYGWVINKEKEKEQLLKDLNGKKPVEREPVYEQRAIHSGLDDIGDTYVEIDYTKQHLWYYKKGRLITDTDIVSGNISRHNGSPDGVFKIVYKQRDATLVGENYASDVKYFMPFAYNVGIHDASWRHGKFGGNIYKTNGSHGCINVPEEIAKKLFKKLEVGTPVIAYYRDAVTLTADNARISNAYSYKPDKKNNRITHFL